MTEASNEPIVTKSGKVLTEDDIRHLAVEAERGYPIVEGPLAYPGDAWVWRGYCPVCPDYIYRHRGGGDAADRPNHPDRARVRRAVTAHMNAKHPLPTPGDEEIAEWAHVLVAAEAGMSRPPNKYRDVHFAIEALGNRLSGMGLLAQASTLWNLAKEIKAFGQPVYDPDTRQWNYQSDEDRAIAAANLADARQMMKETRERLTGTRTVRDDDGLLTVERIPEGE